jgi:hypothetical protein
MSEPEVQLVKPQRFAINFPSVGAPMAIRAEGDKIVIFVRPALRPPNNVMDIDFDVSTSRDRTPVAALDKNAPAELCGY